MLIALLLQVASPAVPTVTLAEAREMSPSALAARLLPNEQLRPIVDTIINGRGLTPPSQNVNRLWLVEQMVPFDRAVCLSHVYKIEMGPDDPAANAYVTALPTHVVKIEQYGRLWAPPNGVATIAACAAAPAQASGFAENGLGLRQAATLAEQARTTFAFAAKSRNIDISCRGKRGACGKDPRKTLAAIDWTLLGLVEQVTPKGETYYMGDPKPKARAWGPSHVQFTFPYAAGGDSWVVTVTRAPDIKSVRMEAQTISYD